MDPRCDALGQQLAYVQGGNLWVQRLGEATPPRQLTQDGREDGTVTHGLAEFIAAEEFDRHRGYWWSPNGQQLLVLRADESGVPIKTRAQISASGTTLTQQRYPAAGEPSAKVTAWISKTSNGQRSALPLPPEAEYTVRAGWFEDGRPWLQWMPRDQTLLTLSEFDPNTGAGRTITTETDGAWVETRSDLLELPGLRLSGKPALLWSTEASGRRQLVVLDRQTGERRPLTQALEPVAKAVCAGATEAVFTAAHDRGRGQGVWAIDVRTSAVRAIRSPASTDPKANRFWADAKADPGCLSLLITESRYGQPPSLSLRGVQSGPAAAVAGSAPDPLLARTLQQPTPLTLTAADGRTPLNGFSFPPAATAKGTKPSKFPVITLAYGGPGGQVVAWRWANDAPLIAYWQQRGYGVFSVDTRGMASRDRAFTRAHHRAFGQVEVNDLFAAVRQMARTVPGVDTQRIGFCGWSYGGYLAARAMLDAKTPFAAAIAVAPVTDWRLYDTAYTERYLGLPDPDSNGTSTASAAPYAQALLPSRGKLLSKPLLLVHGTADDNVLFEHSLRLIEAL